MYTYIKKKCIKFWIIRVHGKLNTETQIVLNKIVLTCIPIIDKLSINYLYTT